MDNYTYGFLRERASLQIKWVNSLVSSLTVCGLFSVSPEHLMNIVDCFVEKRDAHTASRRMMDRGRGKTGHYEQAISYLNQVLPMFTKAIGDPVEGNVN